MSKMGRVVQEIMEKFDGRIPKGYTLEDYFKDKENEQKSIIKASDDDKKISTRSDHSKQTDEA